MMSAHMDKWMAGQMDGWMGGQMGEWVERRKERTKQGKAGRWVVEGWAGRELDG